MKLYSDATIKHISSLPGLCNLLHTHAKNQKDRIQWLNHAKVTIKSLKSAVQSVGQDAINDIVGRSDLNPSTKQKMIDELVNIWDITRYK